LRGKLVVEGICSRRFKGGGEGKENAVKGYIGAAPSWWIMQLMALFAKRMMKEEIKSKKSMAGAQ
jgi:hypothetical protein